MTTTIRVLLVDDHALVLEGLRSMLDAQADMEVVGAITSGAEVLDAIRRTTPDVVALDLEMQPIGGLACLERIRDASLGVKVLVLSAYGDGGSMRAALERGADGYALKTESPRQTLESIRQVHQGHVVFPQAAKRWLLGGHEQREGNRLTERERAVLGLVAEGIPNAEIATRLRVSENTVKFHLQNVFLKLGVSNRTEAAARYLRDQTVG
jgi:DNA-binding NarL/FixJ family response regulator